MQAIPREQLLAAARSVMADGERISLDAVAERAQVSRSTVYRVFGSRRALLAELRVQPERGTRERLLVAALELIGRTGLGGLSMDLVAEHAGVSRAALYRLFPGKRVLFRELVREYAPLEVVGLTLARGRSEPVTVVMPELAGVVVEALHDRVGLIRILLAEVSELAPEAADGTEHVLALGVRAIGAYLTQQMAEGHLRPMHPVLAVQSFIGPLLLHLITRSVAEQRLGFDVPLRDSAIELAHVWLRAMRPD